MPNAELVIWSAMAGVLLALVVAMLVDAALERRLGELSAWRVMALMAAASVAMSGLPEFLWPALSGRGFMGVKVALGPVAAAAALTSLGQWSGLGADDRLVRFLMGPGAAGAGLAGLALLGWYLAGGEGPQVLAWAALVSGLAVLMGALVAIRCVTMGDRLARGMVVGILCLAQMAGGLYGKALALDMGLPYWLLTAVATAGYFALVMALIRMRLREVDRLRRLARGEMPLIDQAGLPRGARLVGKVDDALWRSARMDRPCMVAAIVVTNLYAHGEAAAQDAETEILLTLAARLRKEVGFRNVVGLIHQACFMLAVSAVQDPFHHRLGGPRLLKALRMAVAADPDPLAMPFQPDVAIGVVQVPPGAGAVDAMQVVNLAEQLALEASRTPERMRQQVWGGKGAPQPATFLSAAETEPAPLGSE